MAEKDDLLKELNSNTPGGGSTDRLRDPVVAAKLDKYWAAQALKPKRDESVAKMRARNTALRLLKGKLPRSEEKPKENREVEVQGHMVMGARGRCQDRPCQKWGTHLCFEKRIIVCKMHLDVHVRSGCGQKERP